jgi:hypothetical protein
VQYISFASTLFVVFYCLRELGGLDGADDKLPWRVVVLPLVMWLVLNVLGFVVFVFLYAHGAGEL